MQQGLFNKEAQQIVFLRTEQKKGLMRSFVRSVSGLKNAGRNCQAKAAILPLDPKESGAEGRAMFDKLIFTIVASRLTKIGTISLI